MGINFIISAGEVEFVLQCGGCGNLEKAIIPSEMTAEQWNSSPDQRSHKAMELRGYGLDCVCGRLMSVNVRQY